MSFSTYNQHTCTAYSTRGSTISLCRRVLMVLDLKVTLDHLQNLIFFVAASAHWCGGLHVLSNHTGKKFLFLLLPYNRVMNVLQIYENVNINNCTNWTLWQFTFSISLFDLITCMITICFYFLATLFCEAEWTNENHALIHPATGR